MQQTIPAFGVIRDEFNDIPWSTRFAHNPAGGMHNADADNGTGRCNHPDGCVSSLVCFYTLCLGLYLYFMSPVVRR
jgi:hypothetical protein